MISDGAATTSTSLEWLHLAVDPSPVTEGVARDTPYTPALGTKSIRRSVSPRSIPVQPPVKPIGESAGYAVLYFPVVFIPSMKC